jgi:hypothetical protein
VRTSIDIHPSEKVSVAGENVYSSDSGALQSGVVGH